jgi:ATP-binding cassette, subfamily B, bacterial
MPKKISPLQFLRHFWQIFQFVWTSQASLALGLMSLEFLKGILPVINAWLTKQIFDQLNDTAGQAASHFLNLFLGLLALQISLSLVTIASSQVSQYLSSEFKRCLSLRTEEETYRHLLRLKGLAYFENPKYHELFRMASQGLGMGTNQIIYSLTRLVQSLSTILSFLGLILFLNPLMLLALLLANLPRLYHQLRFGQQRVHLRQEANPKERSINYFNYLLSNMNIAKEIRLFNIGTYILENLLTMRREVQEAERKQELREIRINSSLSLLSVIVTTVMFAFVIYQAYLAQISIGDVMLYTAALGSIGASIDGIIQVIASTNEQVLFFQHYAEFQALKPDLPQVIQPRSVPQLSQGIELRNLSFRYAEDAPDVLKNINLFIPVEQSLALVGLNGSGKTTLVKLLTRLYDPTEGQILWDGFDIREFDIDEFRQHIGAIFQDFVRYDLTARENIGFGEVSAIENLAQIQKAASKTGMHGFLQGLPQEYETILSRWLAKEGSGTDLSGGQWQKVAISRMFMRDADLMILDEPTAALDAEAEYEIFSQFANLVANRTSLLISHRFSTVRMADRIVVLENGTIVEHGSHHELMALNQRYKDLYSKQAMQYYKE